MKRLCLILAFLFLFAQTSSALLLPTPKVVYRGTVTGLRISAVDGTAFIDNLPYTYSSDFSAGVDGWTGEQGTATGNIDSIGGQDNVLRFVSDNISTTHFVRYVNLLTVGKKVTVSFKYYIPSGQSNIDSLVLQAAYWGAYATLSTLDTWTTVTKTFITSSASPRIYASDGGLVVFQDAGGDDVFYIKDITISEITPYMDGNHQIEIYDASNRMLRGVLKAAGTSEGLGDELITGWTNHVTRPYETFTASGKDIASAIDTNSDGQASSNVIGTPSGKLFIFSKTVTLNSGVAPAWYWALGTTIIFGDGLTGNIYKTGLSNSTFLYAFNNANTNFSAVLSLKQVLTPSSSGATIVSAKGGTTYNFSYRNPDFGFNLLSYYVIIRAIR